MPQVALQGPNPALCQAYVSQRCSAHDCCSSLWAAALQSPRPVREGTHWAKAMCASVACCKLLGTFCGEIAISKVQPPQLHHDKCSQS